jgi:arylsulfatase A-like enzyme
MAVMRINLFVSGSCLGLGISAIACVGWIGCTPVGKEIRSDKPNVILIVADDMGPGDLSYFNEALTRTTPYLDRLAGEGVWFDQAYSASPVCAPARASLLTGLYPHQTGCVTLNSLRYPVLTRMDIELYTLADAFHDNGYVTGLIGKWHTGIGEDYHPLRRGFHEFEGFTSADMIPSYMNYVLDIQGELVGFEDQYLTHDLSDRAIEFVRRHQDRPFFLHLAHYAPHRPLDAPDEHIKPYLEKGYAHNVATVYAMIEIMDQGIGALLHELDKLGVRDNTIIIFTSDNGPDPLAGERFNAGLRGAKYEVYEGGVRVPFIITWPNKVKPMQTDVVIHFTDVFPTLIELCELQPTRNVLFEGGSMAGLLLGADNYSLPEARFWQWNRGVPHYSHNAAMRKGKWKLVRPYITRDIPFQESEQRPVLYDLENDPFEEHDVSNEYRIIYQEMRVYLEQWSREMEFRRLQIVDDAFVQITDSNN